MCIRDRDKYEPIRQAAIRVNDLAGNIHSEQDARTFVDAVAEELYGHHLSWITRGMRHRVAHAEYEAVSDPARLIPEQRIVNVWNEYVREIDAPEEALVTVAEVHNMRDAMYVVEQRMWKRDFGPSIWTAPDIHAVDADGRVADGSRALEALKILHDLYFQFQNLRSARERVQQGVLISDRLKAEDTGPREGAQQGVLVSGRQKTEDTKLAAKPFGGLMGRKFSNPCQAADSHYMQNHGQRDYDRLLRRLLEELLPKE